MCSEGTKKAHFRWATICFGKMVLFFGAHSKSPNTTKIGVSAGTGENPKWHFWLQKCHFGKGPGKGLYYLWYLKAVFCWKHYFYSVFSETQLCRNKRVQLEKQETCTKNRGCLPTCKKVFFVCVFCCLVVLFFLCVFYFLCLKKKPKRLFSCNFRVFFFFVPKRPVFKILLFFLFCFLFWFSLFPFQNSIFSLLFVHQTPFLENINIFGFFIFLFLAFSFLFACFFQF